MIAFLAGLFTGTVVGVVTMALLNARGGGDDEYR